jgi:transcription termination/antitermination protein NusG
MNINAENDGTDEAEGPESERSSPSQKMVDQVADESSAELETVFDEEEDDVSDNAIAESVEPEDDPVDMRWYILKVQVNRETSICDALLRKVKIAGLERYFNEVLIPTEEVREFTKTGKQRIVKRKLYPGYIMVNMTLNENTWFLVRETQGIGDFTGSAGKPAPLSNAEVEQILKTSKPEVVEESDRVIKTAIGVRPGDRVRVKDGYFQNFEGDIESVDESNGRVTVMINIFGRPTPVELDHWQAEKI